MFRILVIFFLGTIQLSPLENVPTRAPRTLTGYRVLIFIQDTQRATIVTSLHVTLSCLRSYHLPNYEHAHMDGKHCTRLDIALGEALHYMVNLKSLQIHCRLCLIYKRHSYLAHLVMPQLRDLSVDCGCGRTTELYDAKMNNFPIFDTVEALRWSISPVRPVAIPYNPTKFTKLKAIEYHGREVGCSLLSTRPIQRLLFHMGNKPNDPLFVISLTRSPRVLTHLIFQSYWLMTEMLPQISSLLGKLQHIGTVRDYEYSGTVRNPKHYDGLLTRLLRQSPYNPIWAH